MKYIILLNILIFICFCSCKKQKQEILPVEKFYIIEYDLSSELKNDSDIFASIYGFCELNKNFELIIALRSYDKNYFYESETSIPDSMKSRICKILQQDLSDAHYYPNSKFTTSFPVQNLNDSSYYYVDDTGDIDHHYHFFLIEKADGSQVTIDFLNPNHLPSDLRYLYHFLYRKNRNLSGRKKFNGLFHKLNEDFWYNFDSLPYVNTDNYEDAIP